jgi:hypothetical protein
MPLKRVAPESTKLLRSLCWVRQCGIPDENSSWVAKADTSRNNMIAEVAGAADDKNSALLCFLLH